MEISAVDLGVCRGYAYAGDPRRTAIVLPGAMLGGMPVNAFAIYVLVARGWSVVQVWDEFRDRSLDATEWTRVRAEAALRDAGDPPGALVVAKSLTTRAAGLAAERSLPAVWLTPLLVDAPPIELLRARTAPALLVGGTADPDVGRCARPRALRRRARAPGRRPRVRAARRRAARDPRQPAHDRRSARRVRRAARVIGARGGCGRRFTKRRALFPDT